MKREYLLLDKAAIRVASNPINVKTGDIELNSESIYISSKSLSNQLSNEKLTKSAVLSLKKYKIRSQCRTTPFGLMASTGYLNFAKKDYLEKDSNVCKKVSLDGRWVASLINYIKQNNKAKLRVKWNNSTLNYIGSRIVNEWVPFNHEDQKRERISIENTNAVKIVEKLTTDSYISKKELIEKIYNKYNRTVEEKVIVHFLEDLEEKGFLITDLDSMVLTTDPGKLFSELSSTGYILPAKNTLCNILQLIEDYQKSDVDTLIILKRIESCLSSIVSSESYLKVECFESAKSMEKDKIETLVYPLTPYLSFAASNYQHPQYKKILSYYMKEFGNLNRLH